MGSHCRSQTGVAAEPQFFRHKFLHDDGESLDEQLNRFMESSEDSIAWFSTLKTHLDDEPRKVVVQLKGSGASLTGRVGVGGRPVTRTVGHRIGEGTFTVSVDQEKAGLLGEDAVMFAPAKPEEPPQEGEPPPPRQFRGESIYHRLKLEGSDGSKGY